MPSAEDKHGIKRPGRWLRRMFWGTLALGIAFAGACFTGLPQRHLAIWLLSSQLGARAEIARLSLANPLTLDGVSLRGDSSVDAPLLSAGRIEATWAARPPSGRHISQATAKHVTLALRDAGDTTNYQFLLDRFAGPGGGADPTPWIPEALALAGLQLDLDFPEYGLQAGRINLDLSLASVGEGTVRLEAPDLAMKWRTALDGDTPRTGAGTLTANGGWSAEGVQLDLDADLGPLARVQGALVIATVDTAQKFDLKLPEARLQDPLWAAMLGRFSPVPIQFDDLDLSRSEVAFHFPESGLVVDKALVEASANAVVVGPPEAPWYSGPLKLALDGAHGATTDIKGTITLRDNVPIESKILIAPEGVTIHAGTSLKDARLDTVTNIPTGGAVTVQSTLRGVAPNAWGQHLLGRDLLSGLEAKLDGSVKLALATDQPLALQLDLKSAGFRYGSMSLSPEAPLSLAGDIKYDLATGHIAGDSLKLARENTADIQATKWSLDPANTNLKAALAGELNLESVGGLFGFAGLYGTANIQGSLAYGPKATSFNNLQAESLDFIYGEWSMPYDMLLALSGNLTYDTSPGALRLEPLKAALGGGTNISVDSLRLQFAQGDAPLALNMTGLKIDSDLDLLERKTYIESATGARAAISSSNLTWAGTSLTGALQWNVTAATLAMPEKLASLTELSTSGHFDLAGATAGGGPLSLGPFTIYEIPFGPLSTQLHIDGQTLAWDRFETSFLGGLLALTGSVRYKEAGYPAAIDAEGTNLDLEQFTQTFKPPDVVMTGKVNGTARVSLTAAELSDLNVNLVASENLTLNQAAVRQILMSQYVNDAVGSKSIQKVIEKVIGKDEQRAFERAELKLRLEDGLVVGTALLVSKALDVTVDIKAEPQAILQAIQSTAERATENSQ